MIKQNKATIKHLIKLPKKLNKNLKVLKSCFLAGMSNKFKTSSSLSQVLPRIRLLQSIYRGQMYRLIATDPSKALQYTYQLNCRPPGLIVQPSTRFCNRPKACPWCATRQLSAVYDALVAVPKEVRNVSRFVGWRRLIPFSSQESLPCVSDAYGPHRWLKAHASAQVFLPGLLQVDDSYQLVYRHIGVHCVPADCDYVSKLKIKFKKFDSNFEYFEADRLSNVLTLMNKAFLFNWLKLFEPEQLSLFQALNADFKRQRCIRIHKYKGD